TASTILPPPRAEGPRPRAVTKNRRAGIFFWTGGPPGLVKRAPNPSRLMYPAGNDVATSAVAVAPKDTGQRRQTPSGRTSRGVCGFTRSVRSAADPRRPPARCWRRRHVRRVPSFSRRAAVQELINTIMQKAGLSADTAKAFVQKVLAFLKGKLPESAVSQLNAALGGALDKVGSAPASLADAVNDSGIDTDKVPEATQALLGELKEQLPESASGAVEKALADDSGF